MDGSQFTPLSALAGGGIMGLAASLLWWSLGRVAGVSGILGGLFGASAGDRGWRVAFLAGLAGAGVVAALLVPAATTVSGAPRGALALVCAGVLAGVGARVGGGCTAGHGVCGLSRLSRRSLVATVTFMATAVATATLAGGGQP